MLTYSTKSCIFPVVFHVSKYMFYPVTKHYTCQIFIEQSPVMKCNSNTHSALAIYMAKWIISAAKFIILVFHYPSFIPVIIPVLRYRFSSRIILLKSISKSTLWKNGKRIKFRSAQKSSHLLCQNMNFTYVYVSYYKKVKFWKEFYL